MPVGTDVHVIAAGRVADILTKNIDTEGQRVSVCHGKEGDPVPPEDCSGAVYYSFYSHMTEHFMTIGQELGKGDRIGKSGTGATGYPHLHFEIRLGEGHREDSVHPYLVLPYPGGSPPDVEITDVDTTDPMSPIVAVTATVPSTELDLTGVEVDVLDAQTGQKVDGRAIDFGEWNYVRTTSGGDAELDTQEIDGVRFEPEPFAQGTDKYRIKVTFIGLSGLPDAKNLKLEARAKDAEGLVGTVTYP